MTLIPTKESFEKKKLMDELLRLEKSNKELTDWKESASRLLNDLDLQGIGKELNLPYGTDIALQVLPKIKEFVTMLEITLSFIEELKHHGIDKWSDEDKLRKLITKHKQL